MKHHSPARTQQWRADALRERLQSIEVEPIRSLAWQQHIKTMFPGATFHGDKVRLPWC